MTTIKPPQSIASITSPNWLAEAYNNIQLAAEPDGILGALQNAKNPGSLRSFINNSFNNANALALIAQDTNQQLSTVGAREAASIYDQAQRAKINARLNPPPQQNFNPPTELPSMIFFGDGTTFDTQKNILTLPDGTQIDTTTGAEYTEPGSIVNMAGGGYLNTKTNILTMPDGTKIDIVTGLRLVGQNHPTTSADVTASTNENSGNPITVSASFDDPDLIDGHTFSANTTGTQGAVTNNLDGTFTYAPNGQFEYLAFGETATDSFSYTVDDGNGGSSTATVTITISGENDDPIANNVATSANENTNNPITIAAEFTDADANDAHAFTIDNTFTIGTVVDNGDGTFTYDPNGQFESLAAGETAVDSFNYTVNDGQGGTSTATVTITITGENDAPLATDDSAETSENAPIVTGNVLDNDTDIDNVLSPSNISTFDTNSTGGGLVTNNGDGTFTYDPSGQFEALAVGETATDTFTYTLDDGAGGTSVGTVTITITGENDAPVSQDVSASANENTGNPVSISANFTDVDSSDNHTFTVDTTGTLGSVINNNDGTFSYDPNGQFESLAAGETAIDTFSYTVDDGNGGTSTSIVTVTITGQNDAPVTGNDTASAGENTPALTGNVLDNDTDIDTMLSPANISAFDATSAHGGVIISNGDGTFVYDANGQFESLSVGETATDTFNYTLDDGAGGTAIGTVTVTITGENDAPVSQAVSASANENSGNPISINANYSDVDADDNHAFTIDTNGTLGNVVNNNDGTFSYDPNGQFEGLAAGETAIDTFSYTVDDGNGGTSTSVVTVTITGENDTPNAANDIASAGEHTPSATGNVLDNDTDVDNSLSPVNISAFDATSTHGGVVTSNGDGSFTYDANGQFESLSVGESVTDTFTYTIDDGAGGTSTGTVTVTITGENDAPVSQDISASANENSGNPISINANYSDVDANDNHAFTIDTNGTLGNVVNNSDGTFAYDPNDQFESLAAGETAIDTFSYTVDDGNGGTSTSVVTVTVTGENDAPVAADDNLTTSIDAPVTTGNVLANDTDVDGALTPANITAFDATSANGGTVENNGDGTFTYTPALSFTGSDSFTYTIDDGQGGSSTATVTITVTP